MINNQIGRRLRDLRRKRGLTQNSLAEMAGIDYTYVGKIERGEQLPSLKILIKFAECLSLPLDRFFVDEPTLRLASLIPAPVYKSAERENLWELLSLLGEAADEDISLLTEILRVLKKHREIKKEVLPMVAEKSKRYRKKSKKGD